MRRQSNPITPHGTWLELSWSKFNWTVYFFAGCISIRFIACIKVQSFSGCFIFLHLSTLPRSDFPGTHGAKKITYLFCFERAHYKVYIFLCFLSWHMQTLQRARNVCRLNSQISKDDTFDYYPFFVLNIPLFTILTFSTFSYRNFFVCFDILWQLATTHSTGTQIVRAKMTSLDAIFCRGNKSSSRSGFCCRRKHKKIYRSRFALVKKFELEL